MFLFFYPKNTRIASKILEPTICTSKSLKKKFFVDVEASPQGYLIVTK